ncbi:hypothetical protein [Dyella psychrodurans]|uniref:Ankyrin repeat domain-containing protein n=1 Tax=Dyella psychrodurans TaxID=1927960 RepID=A0A370XBN9_9GAMM|nr:hypothetical protein [Dyella psychrodurans]RDS85844.1 hypothetical protein DWU99_00795 [Dyella psychrodurans]
MDAFVVGYGTAIANGACFLGGYLWGQRSKTSPNINRGTDVAVVHPAPPAEVATESGASLRSATVSNVVAISAPNVVQPKAKTCRMRELREAIADYITKSGSIDAVRTRIEQGALSDTSEPLLPALVCSVGETWRSSSWRPVPAGGAQRLYNVVDMLLLAGADPRGETGNIGGDRWTARQSLLKQRSQCEGEDRPIVQKIIQRLTDAERALGIPESELSNAGTAKELAECAAAYIRHDGNATYEDVVRLVEQGAPINEQYSVSSYTTPLHAVVDAYWSAKRTKFDGPADMSRVLVLIHFFLDHAGDPRMIDNDSNTPRNYLEAYTMAKFTPTDPISAEAIRLLEEGERAAERRELEQAAVGGATERSGTRRMM